MFLLIKDNYPLLIVIPIIIILMLTTFHGDLAFLTVVSNRISLGDFNIYKPVLSTKPIGPPFMFYFDSFLFYITKKIFNINFVNDSTLLYGSLNYLQNFLVKFRYLIIFLISYPLVKKIAFLFDKKNAKLITNIWITSPVLFCLTFTQGNNDLYPVLFTLISIFFVLKKQNLPAIIFIALAACLKNYALFLIFPLSLILAEKKFKKTLLYVFVSMTIYSLSIFPYLNEFSHFLQAGGEGSSIFNNTFLGIPFFWLFYIIINLYLLFGVNEKQIINNKINIFIRYSFLILSLFFITNNFLPQWFLWVLPFFVLIVYKNEKLFYLNVLMNCVYFFVTVLFYPRNLDLNLFQPIVPLEITLKAYLSNNPITSTWLFQVIFATIFVGLYITFIYFFIYKEKYKTHELNKHYVAFNLIPFFFI